MTPQEIYIRQFQKALQNQIGEKDTMKGFIRYRPERCRWVIVWWDVSVRKKIFIGHNRGEPFTCTAFKSDKGQPILDEKGRLVPDKTKCQGYARAEKLLALMRNRQDQAIQGECKFQIEEFSKSNFVAVSDIYKTWINEAIVGSRKPATVKGYLSYQRNWIEPWFKEHPIALHEVDLATLMSFMKHIKKTLQTKNKTGNVGKTVLNIMSSLHSAMDYAHRNGKLKTIPPFPKLEDYGLVKPKIEWLDKEDLDKVFASIPEVHKPIFLWLKMHFRRPGEACALYKTDYDAFRQAFTIQRAVSAREVVNSVKTNWKNPTIHYIPCDQLFVPVAEKLINQNPHSPYIFVNPRARKEGGRYTLESLKIIWYTACDTAGVTRIWPYRGLKHTACTHFMENGGTEVELQKLTGHKNMKSLTQYTDITLERIRKVQEDAKQREEEMERRRKECKNNIDGKVIFFKRKDDGAPTEPRPFL